MLESLESFSPEEVKKLSPFVTNTDKSIFVLQNLPEVIKGALFSRYSRSKLGLRSLLIKDFMAGDESSFSDIVGSAGPAGEAQNIAIQKAQSFYDRILDGYGDDSIGELGGAHLALERVSMVATKEIEDCRIGGSPLEKSTRYIYFDEKVDGDFQFVKEPTIMNSEFADLYLKTSRNFFEVYTELITPLKKFLESKIPLTSETSQRAYAASMRAKVCDALRGLLPASTQTNMGVFGNGRFFESFLQKMNRSSLSELREIGLISHQELSKVIPSFIRRSMPGHRHFDNWNNFMNNQDTLVNRLGAELKQTRNSQDGVKLLPDFSHNLISSILSSLLFEKSQMSLDQINEIVKNYSDEQIKQIFQELGGIRENRRHKPPRAFEHAFFTFDLLGDYGMYRDLQRHRMLTQERQYLSTNHGYAIPGDIILAGLKEPYCKAMDSAKEAYFKISKVFPREAQYIVPMGYNIPWYFKINLRSLLWLCELRSSPQGHEAYRKMACDMARAVMDSYPVLSPLFKFVDFNDYSLGRLDQETKWDKKKQVTQ